MASSPSLYDEVVAVTADYLGPAADRFVVRQIRNHLQKDPTELKRQDLRQLIEWIQLAMHMLSDDSTVINSYVAKLEGLTHATNRSFGSPHGKAPAN